MKKLVFLAIISALFLFGVAHGQTNGQKVKNTTKKMLKMTSKGVGTGYRVSKNLVFKGTKATINGVKNIFK